MEKCADFEWPEVGQRIRARRLAQQKTQQHLAEKAGLTQNAIFRLEAGDTNPQINSLRAVASALGTNVRELVCGVGDADPRLSDRLIVVRRILESGDDAAIRAMDYGLENAQTVLDRTRGFWEKEPASVRIGGRTYRRPVSAVSAPVKKEGKSLSPQSRALPASNSRLRWPRAADPSSKEMRLLTEFQLKDAPHLPGGTEAKVAVPKSTRNREHHEHSSELAARKDSASSRC